MEYLIIALVIAIFAVHFCTSFKNGLHSQKRNNQPNSGSRHNGDKIMQCPNCGASLRLKPGATQWECGWCGNYGKLG